MPERPTRNCVLAYFKDSLFSRKLFGKLPPNRNGGKLLYCKKDRFNAENKNSVTDMSLEAYWNVWVPKKILKKCSPICPFELK
jgi:hypothetical protein